MKNCRICVEGDELVLRINLKERIGESNSRRSDIIGSTEGNVPVHDGKEFLDNIFVNATVFQRRSKDEFAIRTLRF